MKFKLPARQDISAESITGVTFDFGDGVRFHSLRAGGSNAKYTAARAVMQQKIMREFGSRVPDDKLREYQAKLYADTCLIGWDGVTDERGGPMPYTAAAGFALLMDPEYDIYWLEYDRRVADPRNFTVEGATGATAQQVGEDLGKS